jgi:predicted PurR-regulated permease PerM
MSFFRDVGNFFKPVGTFISNGFQTVIENPIKAIHQDIRDVVGGIGSIANNGIQSTTAIISKEADLVGSAINKAGDIGTGLTDFLSSPTALIMALGAAYIFLKV